MALLIVGLLFLVSGIIGMFQGDPGTETLLSMLIGINAYGFFLVVSAIKNRK